MSDASRITASYAAPCSLELVREPHDQDPVRRDQIHQRDQSHLRVPDVGGPAALQSKRFADVGEAPTESDRAHTQRREAYPRTFRDCDPR